MLKPDENIEYHIQNQRLPADLVWVLPVHAVMVLLEIVAAEITFANHMS